MEGDWTKCDDDSLAHKEKHDDSVEEIQEAKADEKTEEAGEEKREEDGNDVQEGLIDEVQQSDEESKSIRDDSLSQKEVSDVEETQEAEEPEVEGKDVQEEPMDDVQQSQESKGILDLDEKAKEVEMKETEDLVLGMADEADEREGGEDGTDIPDEPQPEENHEHETILPPPPVMDDPVNMLPGDPFEQAQAVLPAVRVMNLDEFYNSIMGERFQWVRFSQVDLFPIAFHVISWSDYYEEVRVFRTLNPSSFVAIVRNYTGTTYWWLNSEVPIWFE